MLANVSHEFRTPLNAISMSLILLKGHINEERIGRSRIENPQKFIKIATSSCDILASLVEDILDHAKIESGGFEIHETEFQFNNLFDEVKDIFEMQ
mmetsp:Transcript_16906/g.14829  ORF Transcript_16906/g.14829 Transcript_16906/m.14829 type:complete len:96 (+) Transcript_16906:857-1144(+)